MTTLLFLSFDFPLTAFCMLTLPSGLALGRCAGTCVCCAQLSAPRLGLGLLHSCVQAPGGLCLSWLPVIPLPHLPLSSHFVFLSKLGTRPAILSMQLSSINTATCSSAVGAWLVSLRSFLVGHMALDGPSIRALSFNWGLCH